MYCRGIFPLVIICVAGLESTLPYRKQKTEQRQKPPNPQQQNEDQIYAFNRALF